MDYTFSLLQKLSVENSNLKKLSVFRISLDIEDL